MKRVLVFEGANAPKRFELLWAALQAGGDGKGERTPVVIRKEARLFDTLEQISEAATSSNGNDPAMAMRALVGQPTLEVAQDDYDLLVQYSEKTPWTPRVSRDVVDLWDWLSAADKKEKA